VPGAGWQGSETTAAHTHLVVEKADLEDVLHSGNAVCHRQITHGVPQQDDAGPSAQLLEVLGPLQDAVVLVVGVDERSLETPEDSLGRQDRQTDPTAIPPLCRSLSTHSGVGKLGGCPQGTRSRLGDSSEDTQAAPERPGDSPRESPSAGQALPRR